MFDFIMTEDQKKLRDEARDFSCWVPKEMILAMDADELQFPHEYLREAGRRNLLGIRISKEFGGRGLGWVEDCFVAEEIGVASYSLACLWGVGADIVCEAVTLFGSDELKQQIVVPLLKGEVYAAEGLTEPRGGSDFFGAVTKARKDGERLDHQRTEALHRGRRRCRLVPRLCRHRSRRSSSQADDRLHGPPHQGRRIEIHIRAHGRQGGRRGPGDF